ncbi:MAG: hypothetical protein M5U14_10825 [Acidimicrobiia bacterium]|nr:hypothetical protein [Acidimicrobiia bacterium]
MGRLVVDAMNVVGSRPDGWWRDRAAATRRLLERLQGLARSGEEVTLVVEGRAARGLPEGDHGGVLVRRARHSGADAADDLVVELVAGDPDPASLVVVTADRALRRRVEALGARVGGPTELLDRLDRG